MNAQSLQAIVDDLAPKVDAFLGTASMPIAVVSAQEFPERISTGANDYAKQHNSKPGRISRSILAFMTKRAALQFKRDTIAYCHPLVPDTIFLTGEEPRKNRTWKDTAAHEITHTRIYAHLRNDPRFFDSRLSRLYTNPESPLITLDEGFAEYVASHTAGLAERADVEIYHKARTILDSGRARPQDLQKLEYATKGLESSPNLNPYVIGYHFCKTIGAHLGREHLKNLAFNPLNPEVTATMGTFALLQTIWHDQEYQFTEEELKNPEKYIARINAQNQQPSSA